MKRVSCSDSMANGVKPDQTELIKVYIVWVGPSESNCHFKQEIMFVKHYSPNNMLVIIPQKTFKNYLDIPLIMSLNSSNTMFQDFIIFLY